MADLPPLDLRVLDGVRAVAEATASPDVPAGRVYRRAVLDWTQARDGLPCVIVAPTPGRPLGVRKTLSKRETTYAVTALLLDSQGGSVAADPAWRLSWAGRMNTALDGLEVAEAINVNPDNLAQLDTSAFEAAGLWRAACSVLVVCRQPR